jgi:hypothetical protein
VMALEEDAKWGDIPFAHRPHQVFVARLRHAGPWMIQWLDSGRQGFCYTRSSGIT